MLKNKKIIFAIILCLFPIIYGSFFYNKLPEMLPTHFNFQGDIDKYSTKFSVIYIQPLILSIITLFMYIMTKLDPRKISTNNKALVISFFIFPLVSNLMVVLSITKGFGYSYSVPKIVLLVISIIFILLGNYIPKVPKNYILGFKMPWTLEDEDNWIKTNKVGGICFIICGIMGIISIFTNMYIFFIGVVILVVFPTIYSYYIYKN